GDGGQIPLLVTNVQTVPSWSTNGVRINSTNTVILAYRDVETNGAANINCRNGTITFWFKPDWNSSNTNSGVGPQSQARLLELGGQSATNGWWALVLDSSGTNLSFITRTNGIATTNLNVPLTLRSNDWHEFALTYSADRTAFYLDGQPMVTNGVGVQY